MRVRNPILAAVHVTLLSFSTLIAPAAKAEIIWGVNGHPLMSYPGISFEAQLDYVRELGMKSYRVNVSELSQIEPLRRLGGAAAMRGITILPVLTPGLDLDHATPEALQHKAYDFSFALVSSLKGQMPVWELGNELENYAIVKPCEMLDNGTQYNCSWGPAGGNSALDYFGPRWSKVSAVLKGLSEGTHAADPNARRAMGSAGWGHVGMFERLKADGIDWDISVWHMYGEDPEWAFKLLSQYGKPIWVTEFNNPSGSEQGEEGQAQGLRRAMARLSELRARYHVEAAQIYELLDEAYWGEGYEAHMGLVSLERTEAGGWRAAKRKQAFEAVKEQIQESGGHAISPARNCSLYDLSASASAARSVVSYAYCLVLDRAPDGGGLQSYALRLESEMTVRQLLLELLNSDEFVRLHKAGDLSDTDYAALLYRVLLNREPRNAELKGLPPANSSPSWRVQLQSELLISPEFRSVHPDMFPSGRRAAIEGSSASDGALRQ
jgi:Domain of unknown function (DUF4214)/Glycosyl hydrolase catalytic core